MSVDNLFVENKSEDNKIQFAHLGYYLYHKIVDFFHSPYKKQKRELNILDTIQTLLESETSDDNISRCQELSRLHRVVENTKARRRLEKWSLRVIAWYLIIVFAVVVVCYTNIPWLNVICIPWNIMVAILTTTTVNIIGLGLIVLRGHFLANDASNNMEGDSK